MKKILSKLSILLIALSLCCVFIEPIYEIAQAKSVYCSSTNISAQIEKNGDVKFTESRVFYFDGDFTYGYFDLPRKGFSKLSHFTVMVDGIEFTQAFQDTKEIGTFFIEDTKDKYTVYYYSVFSYAENTITFSYTIEGSITLYEDFGEFSWQLQGKDWDIGSDLFEADVKWTEAIPLENYYIWGHGPNQGNFERVDQYHAHMSCPNLYSSTVVHARVLLPASYFSNLPVKKGTILESAIEEETNVAKCLICKWVQQAKRTLLKSLLEAANTIMKWFCSSLYQ